MAGFNIQQKIKSGLAKAVRATGPTAKVYKIEMINTGGNSPLDPPVVTESQIELINAVFKSYDKSIIDGTMIQSGDRELISDDSVLISTGDTIEHNGSRYTVISVDDVSPVGVTLLYSSQLRLQ